MLDKKMFWLNESDIREIENGVEILAKGPCDLFCALDGETITKNAALYGCEMTGDCVLEAKVSLKRSGDYDGAGLILYSDERHWAKTCLECTDFGKTAVITVMTDGISDDANGPNITADAVWLRLVRKGNDCSVHYSLDGTHYEMFRICHVELKDTVMAALVAQAPVGEGGYWRYEDIHFEQKTVDNLRTGV